MALGNYTKFRAKHVTSFQFGETAWTETQLASTGEALDTSFESNNGTVIVDLVGSADTENPTKSYAFAKDFQESGNEKPITKEDLLGTDSVGSQNQELYTDGPSEVTVETTIVYRNPLPGRVFSASTKCCLITMDNSESTTTGELNLAYNNIEVLQAGALSRNQNGLMEQKIKFACRGGEAGSEISVTQADPSESWSRVRFGIDKAEEIRTA